MASGLLAFAQDEPVTITVLGSGVGQEQELTRAGAQRYMDAHPNVTVNVLDLPDQVDDVLALYLQNFQAQSSEFDVLQIDVIWPGDLQQHLVDLNDYGVQEVVDQHFPAMVENNTVDGRLVALPWFTNGAVLYYRTDLLEKYGFAGPPETWDELETMARTIQEGERADNPDFNGFVWQGNAYEGLTCDALEWIASNNGGTIISPDGVITINNDNAIEIVEKAAGWVGTISPQAVTGFAEEDSRSVFQSGNTAFMRNWPYAYVLGNEEASAVAGKFNVTLLPAGEGGSSASCLGGSSLAVSKYSRNPEVAADVALFLGSYEEQKIRAIEGSLNPTIPALYEDPEVLEAVPFFSSLYNVFVNGVPRPSTVVAPQYAEVSRAFYTAVHDVLTGKEDAETALGMLELDLEEITGLPTGAPQ
jgi:trehalose/maltose transport system substrate-binding protein